MSAQRFINLEQELLDGKLDYQQLERLPAAQERTVLLGLNQVLLERGLCLRESTDKGALLVFPSFFRRERPIPTDRPAAFVTYKFQAFAVRAANSRVNSSH